MSQCGRCGQETIIGDIHLCVTKGAIMSEKKIEDGGPAFGHGSSNGHCCGMTLRDYFATEAMGRLIQMFAATERETIADVFAKSAYAYADAMLIERGKGGGE